MKTMLRLLTVVSACAALAACSTEIPSVQARSRGPAAGTWQGEWHNSRAHTSGTVSVTVMNYTVMGYAYYEVTGDPFECGEPLLTGTVTLTPGIDFTVGALTLDIDDPILGQLSLDSHGRKVRGGGAGGCGGKGGAWDTKTKFRARKVSGKVLLDGDSTGKVSYKVKPCTGGHCGLPAAPAG
jgi:hypothetical protein